MRDADSGHLFMQDVAGGLANRVLMTTDGHRVYFRATMGAFGQGGIDYAMLDKVYGNDATAPRSASRLKRHASAASPT